MSEHRFERAYKLHRLKKKKKKKRLVFMKNYMKMW